MKNSPKIYDVLIVGAGPVGLFLACELRQSGVDVLVLEAQKNRTSPLKGAPLGLRGLTVATVETFYRREMLDDLRSLAKSHLAPKGGSPVKDQRGGHFAGIGISFENVDESRWIYRLPGPAASPMGATMEDIEQVLNKRAKFLGVTIKYDCQFTDLRQTSDDVHVIAGGDRYKARWVVGCDGGRSQVRRTTGFDFVGTEAEFTAYTGIVTIADPQKLKPGRNLTPYGFYMQPLPGYISVMEFDGGAFDRSQGVTREQFQKVLRRVSGTDVSVTNLQIATSYSDRAKLTTTLQIGRVLLAGDASHIHSPLGGQGLNVGLGDALNLGWKLAAEIKRAAPAHLLDSYFTERHPVAEWALAWTRAQVQLMKPDLKLQALRHLMTELMQTRDGATYFAEKLWSISLRYELGSDHPIVGMSVPDFELFDGTRIGSHFEGGKGIFINFNFRQDVSAFEAQYSNELKFITAKAKDTLGFSALLVRPDGVVCWIADDKGETAKLTDALVRWFGK